MAAWEDTLKGKTATTRSSSKSKGYFDLEGFSASLAEHRKQQEEFARQDEERRRLEATQPKPQPEPKKPNLLQQVGGAIIAAPKRVATGIARALPGGTADLEAARRASDQQAENVRLISEQLRDPKIPAERKERLKRVLTEIVQDDGGVSETLAKINDDTDKRKFLAALAETGLMVTPIGVGRAATAKAATTVAKATRGAAAIGAEGAVGGTLVELQQDDPTIRGALESAALGAAGGAVLGGVTPIIGAKIKTLRGKQPKAPSGAAGTTPPSTLTTAPTAQATTPVRTGAPTTRTQQFTDTLQRQLVEQLESSPTFKADVTQRQAVEETYRLAAERGAIDLFGAKAGGAIDAVDVARARASLEPYLNRASTAISEGATPSTVRKAMDDATKALEGYHNITSEPGRALQIQSTFNKQSLQYLNKLNDYYKTTGGRLTTKQADEMRRMLGELAETTDRLPSKLKDRALAFVRGAEEFATAAKVSSPVTHMRNIVGNTLTFTQRGIEKVPATILSAVRGQTGAGELRYIFGTTAGWQSAAKKFSSIMNDALRLRTTADEASRLAREGYKEYIPGKVGALVRTPFKILEATDEFGKAILRDSKLHTDAYALAYREGLRGDRLKQRIAQLIETPTDGMLKAAEKEALEFTFQSELGGFGKVAQKIQSMPGGKFFLPFVKTPTNIMSFYAQRSPIGVLSPRNLRDIFKGDVRSQNEAIARITAGSLFSAGAMAAVSANSDRFTGAAPTNPTEKDIFYASGKRPYSIKIGNRWISYQNFQPAGMYILSAVALKEAMDKNDEEEAGNIAATMTGIAAKGLLELPFVQGMNNVLEALNDPDRNAQRSFERLATGFVPNIARDFRLFSDEVVRAPDGLKQSIADMLPGLSKGVESRLDIFGEPITNEGGPLERSFLRFGGVTETTPDRARIALDQVGRETGYYPGAPGRRVGGNALNDNDYRRYAELSGRYFKEAVNNSAGVLTSDGINPEAKEKIVKRAVERARERARRELRFSTD